MSSTHCPSPNITTTNIRTDYYYVFPNLIRVFQNSGGIPEPHPTKMKNQLKSKQPTLQNYQSKQCKGEKTHTQWGPRLNSKEKEKSEKNSSEKANFSMEDYSIMKIIIGFINVSHYFYNDTGQFLLV